jgi:hypothetical protein
MSKKTRAVDTDIEVEFQEKPPEWQAVGVEPPDELKKSELGWRAGYKPPASYFNWFFSGFYRCMKEIQEKAKETQAKIKKALEDILQELSTKAPKESPALTGVPTAPTADKGTATDQLATTKFVDNIVGSIDFSALQDHTKYVQNANINTLLDDQAYICSGTLTNTPIATTYCIVRAYDTAETNRIVQVCYVPQSDNTVRTFVRSSVAGSTFGKWFEYGNVKSVNGILPNNQGNVEIPVATTASYGVMKVADDNVALLDEATDAAITPAVYHDVSDFRHKNTEYKLGDKVECMFNFELFLECTQGGTTSENPLDTRNVTHGQIITDGTAEWTVRTHIKSINGVVAGADGDINVKSLISTEIPVNADLNNYKEAGMYTCHLDATAATILNAPSPNAFFLEVRTMTDCIMQLYTAFPFNLSMYVRLYYAADGWGAWKEIAMFNTAGHLVMPNGAEFWIA